jgi:AraC-like DNA-binding protein
MKFVRINPDPALRHLIDCYWIIESMDTEVHEQKIIPDGFTELIFHYGDAYVSQLHDDRQTQARNLLAGQISNYFYLNNTGISGIVAVKLKPAALTQLFNIDMSSYTDKIVDIARLNDERLLKLSKLIVPFAEEEVVKTIFDGYFMKLITSATTSPVTAAIDLVFKTNGMAPVKDLAIIAGVGERQLERLFKKYVGLSPKYYARIIRFNYIFKLIQAYETSWADIVYQAGYYDQSHFIRNFKAFTGEDPSSYFFEEDNMANFFLKKQK